MHNQAASLGQLHITVCQQPWRVQVQLQRAPVAQLLLGKTPQEAVELICAVHGICRQAQGEAARRALSVAGARAGCDLQPAQDSARQIALECLQEHLWRLLKDWPSLCGLVVPTSVLVSCYRLLQSFSARPTPDWQALQTQLAAQLQEVQRVQHDSLQAIQTRVPAALGCAALQARLQARWQALQQWLTRTEDAVPTAATPTAATPRIATARGMLEHRVRLQDDGRIAAYVIITPTDVHFAADGDFAATVNAWPAWQATETLAQRLWALRAWILAFDPCLPYQLNLQNRPEDRAVSMESDHA